MKTLLIPTDLDVQSLNSIPSLVKQFNPEKLNIILVHMMKITDSITDLLMLPRRSSEFQRVSQNFKAAFNKLKNQYANNINTMRIEFFYGNTVAVLSNFLEANEVDTIILLKEYDYKLNNEYSIDPTVLLKRCEKPKMFADFNPIIKPEAPKKEEHFLEQRF